MEKGLDQMLEMPAYGMVEAAQYVRVKYRELEYWVENAKVPLIVPARRNPVRLSFTNLLECHVLAAMTKVYDVRTKNVRNAVRTLRKLYPSPHPLLDRALKTDRVHIFTDEFDDLVNLSKHGERPLFRDLIALHLERIEQDASGLFRFFPFVVRREQQEPKLIEIHPAVGFGRPVIAGTGVLTSTIASRFQARETISELAEEYGRTEQEIQEAILWETSNPVAA